MLLLIISMLLIPILILLLAAGATWMVRNRPSRIQWVVSALFALFLWLISLIISTAIPSDALISIWKPAALFLTPLEFILDRISWGLIYSIATVLLSLILTAATRPEAASAGMRSFWFVYAALAMVTVLAENLLTVLLAFALLDLCSFTFVIYHIESGGNIRRAIIRAGVDLGGLLLILSAAWMNSIEGIGAGLDATAFSPPGALLFLMGILLRLGLIPLDSALPMLSTLRRGSGMLLRLLPPALAMSLLARFLDNGVPSTLRIWLVMAGAIGILVGGVRWLLEEDRILASPFFIMGLAGVGILTSSSASAPGDVLLTTSILLLLIGFLPHYF